MTTCLNDDTRPYDYFLTLRFKQKIKSGMKCMASQYWTMSLLWKQFWQPAFFSPRHFVKVGFCTGICFPPEQRLIMYVSKETAFPQWCRGFLGVEEWTLLCCEAGAEIVEGKPTFKAHSKEKSSLYTLLDLKPALPRSYFRNEVVCCTHPLPQWENLSTSDFTSQLKVRHGTFLSS